MKLKSLLLSVYFLIPSWGYCQLNYSYEEAIARAGLFHLQKKYKDAILYYEKAFRLQQPDGLTAYKAAGVYSLDSSIEKAFYYLELALQSGWQEADMLATDPYFDKLRTGVPQKWEHILETAIAEEKKYERGLKMPALRREVNKMTLNDQRLRYARIQANDNEKRRIDQEIYRCDSSNRVKIKMIMNQHGWPKISEVGKDGQNNFWLLVQHADEDVIFQQSALAAMQKLRGTVEINLENYAFLYDRVQCNLNYKQLYGTQVDWSANGEASGFRRIIREDMADERREAIGLVPLRIYALTYGFTYDNISASQAKENDSSDLLHTRSLIDSANYFHVRNEFQKVYDYYNLASMIPGGMSNSENYAAAVLFSQIATQNNNPQYKSIALDFLNLLYLRGKLTKEELKPQRSFRILYRERRWTEIYSHLNE